MVGQRCESCRQENPPGNSFCQTCGAPLNSRSVIVSPDKSVNVSKPQLPARQLKRLGASVVIGAVALLAEVGVVYMRRRVQRGEGPRLLTRRKRPLPAQTETRIEEKKTSGKRVITVFSERIVEERRWGRPVRRIVDRLAWRSEETLES